MSADAECIKASTGFYETIVVCFAISTALFFCVYFLQELGNQAGRSTIKEL